MANVIRLRNLKNEKNEKSQVVANSVDVLFQILLIAADETRIKFASRSFALFESKDRARVRYIDAWSGEDKKNTKNLLEILAVVKAILHCESSGLKETLADLIYTHLISDQWKRNVTNLARKPIAVQGYIHHILLVPVTVANWVDQLFECDASQVPHRTNILKRDFNCRARTFFNEKIEKLRQKNELAVNELYPL